MAKATKSASVIGFRVDEAQFDKFKYIVWHERTTQTAEITSMVDDYIAKFEKKNGPITPEMIKKAKG